MKLTNTKLITNKGRVSYAHIFEPHAVQEGEAKKYSLSFLIPKDDLEMLEAVEQAQHNAKAVGKEKFGNKFNALKVPLRDGDVERPEDAAYANMMFINCSSNSKPGVIDLAKNKLEPGDIVSGDWARVSVNFYPFAGKSKGIACGLGNVQLLEKGEPLSGGSSAKDDFDDDEFIDDDGLV